MMAIIACLVSAAVFALFATAIRGYFTYDRMPGAMKILSGLATVSFLAFTALLLLSEPNMPALIAGILLHIASAALFVAAKRAAAKAHLRIAFDPAAPAVLVTDGPYRFVRHPFYLSYMIYWSGSAISCWSPFGLIPLALLFPFYIYAAIREERTIASSPLANQYRAYKMSTGTFIPNFILY